MFTRLIWLAPDDIMMQLNSREGKRCPGIYSRLHYCQRLFCESYLIFSSYCLTREGCWHAGRSWLQRSYLRDKDGWLCNKKVVQFWNLGWRVVSSFRFILINDFPKLSPFLILTKLIILGGDTGFCLNGPLPYRLIISLSAKCQHWSLASKWNSLHFFQKRIKKKATKQAWILVCFVQINHFSKFLFLGKFLIWLNRVGSGFCPNRSLP